MQKSEMDNMDVVTLNKEVHSLQRELFNLKFNGLSEQMKDSSQFKKVRRNIARLKTVIRQKEQAS